VLDIGFDSQNMISNADSMPYTCRGDDPAEPSRDIHRKIPMTPWRAG
jgi:hypothetical protein